MSLYNGRLLKKNYNILREETMNTMIKPGLVSVSFRHLSYDQIIKLAQKAEIAAIEWGGDIHVPHGNYNQAEIVANLTSKAGIETVCYGSYYRVGDCGELKFDTVLKTAEVLRSPMIRVWAGSKASAETSEEYKKTVFNDTLKIADMAAVKNIKISFECHDFSLTDTQESCIEFFNKVNHKNVYIHWQPYNGQSVNVNLSNLKSLLPWLSNIHIFHWWPTIKNRCLLYEGQKNWLQYLKIFESYSKPVYGLLEFFKDDCEQNFLQDVKTLKLWLSGINAKNNVN